MKYSEKNSTQTLGSVLGKIIEEKGWSDSLAFSKIEECWAEIAGDKIAEAVKLKSLVKGRLTLTADSSTWRTEMTLRKEQLKERINSFLDKDLIEEIVIR